MFAGTCTALPPAATWWGIFCVCRWLMTAAASSSPSRAYNNWRSGRCDQSTTPISPPRTAGTATARETGWLIPSWWHSTTSDWAKFFMKRKMNGRSNVRSYLHAHQFLVGFDEFVADLHHHAECHRGFLHRDHALVQLRAVTEQDLAGDVTRGRLLARHGCDQPVEHLAKATGRRGLLGSDRRQADLGQRRIGARQRG